MNLSGGTLALDGRVRKKTAQTLNAVPNVIRPVHQSPYLSAICSIIEVFKKIF